MEADRTARPAHEQESDARRRIDAQLQAAWLAAVKSMAETAEQPRAER